MRISEADLRKQYTRVSADWGFIRDTEDSHLLPPFLLYALGSRETNLKNVNSADGHGRGIWQRDDRSFPIPADYPTNLQLQASDAASLLRSHLVYFAASYPDAPTWRSGIAAYNAGRTGVRRKLDAGLDPDTATTHGDYGSDVLERWSYLVTLGVETL